MISVNFTSHKGTVTTIEVKCGISLMHAATQNGVDGILAECGGGGTCATCHVYVDEKWLDKLPPLSDDEQDMLDFAWGRKDNSRLSCHLMLDASLDGLEVHVPSRQT